MVIFNKNVLAAPADGGGGQYMKKDFMENFSREESKKS
jgi:hypothetical protein